MNIRKELIKAGFDDQTNLLSNSDEVEFELYHDLPREGKLAGQSTIAGVPAGGGGLRLKKLKESNEVEITIYNDSGYELLIALAEIEEDVYE